MTKLLLSILILLAFVEKSFGQHPEPPPKKLLKNYSKYVHKFEPKSCWKYVFELKNGLVIKQENYCKNKLTYRTEFEYDEFDNVKLETETYNVNDGEVNNVSETKLEYNDGILIRKEFSYGIVEDYSDFTEHGKPKLIERIDEHDLWPHKEVFDYDKNGNILKSIKYSTDVDITTNKEYLLKAITYFKYDQWNNVTEIYRKYEPKQEFPIPMTGGPFLYEHEYFRYKYKENGLWIKKYKTVNGKEYLIAKRKYR